MAEEMAGLLGDEAVDGAVERADVDPPLAVFAEGGGVGDREAELAVTTGAVQVGDEAAQLALAEVA